MDKSQLNIEKVLSSSRDFFTIPFSLEENVLTTPPLKNSERVP
jgi:hypothetical protein